MQYTNKQTLIYQSLLILILSIACGMPFGIGLNTDAIEKIEDLEIDQIADAEIFDTPTPENTATPTNTPTSTGTPTHTYTPSAEPSSTGTLVVPMTATPIFATPEGELEGASEGGEGGAVVWRPIASADNVIFNGNFEAGWKEWDGVAAGWEPFDNSYSHFGWYRDTWSAVVYEGESAQLLEITANEGLGHRYAGIYQTVDVVAGAEYDFTIHGLVRSDEGNEELSNYGYAMQYGFDYYGGTDHLTVSEWFDLPFPEHPREDPNASIDYNYGSYTTRIIVPSGKLTIFIRGLKKWINMDEGNFDIDAVSLRGLGGQIASNTIATPNPSYIDPEMYIGTQNLDVPYFLLTCNPGEWSDCGGRLPYAFCQLNELRQCQDTGFWGECTWAPDDCP